MVTFSRSSGALGATYQSVITTPPKGSALASGMKARVSRVACQRKELTPKVRRLLPPATMVAPVSMSVVVVLLEPQAARGRTKMQNRTGRIRIGLLYPSTGGAVRAAPPDKPRPLILARPLGRNGGKDGGRRRD